MQTGSTGPRDRYVGLFALSFLLMEIRQRKDDFFLEKIVVR